MRLGRVIAFLVLVCLICIFADLGSELFGRIMLGAAILFFRHAVMELVGQKKIFLSVFRHTKDT
jgi:ABC-type transporter Mla maintaining outer membrane lipid asymmetry permease subunit MlaE